MELHRPSNPAHNAKLRRQDTVAPGTVEDVDFVKPPRLRDGSTVAIVSLSSGLVHAMPHRHEAGKRQLTETFGLTVLDAPHATKPNDWLRANPQARADDLHWALSNPDVHGIVTAIGGDDSIRLTPHLDLDLIRNNPKVFIGFSDTTMQHLAFQQAGVVSFYGPGLLAGFAENGGIHPYVERCVREALFTAEPFDLHAAAEYTDEFVNWADPALASRRRRLWPNPGWTWLQGSGAVEGRLAGGCIESLEMAKGTSLWPADADAAFDGAILLLELSEEAPSPSTVGHWLRNYAAAGTFDRIGALLLARPENYTLQNMFKLWDTVQAELRESGHPDLPLVANVDYGHSSPMGVLPLGCRALVDVDARRITVLESVVS